VNENLYFKLDTSTSVNTAGYYAGKQLDSFMLSGKEVEPADDGDAVSLFAGLQPVEPGSWQYTPRAGYPGCLPKHMGAKSEKIIVMGVIWGKNWDAMLAMKKYIASKNRAHALWSVGIGLSGGAAIPISGDDDLFAIDDIDFDMIRGSTFWVFRMALTNTTG
jgi:hypothetical protein